MLRAAVVVLTALSASAQVCGNVAYIPAELRGTGDASYAGQTATMVIDPYGVSVAIGGAPFGGFCAVNSSVVNATTMVYNIMANSTIILFPSPTPYCLRVQRTKNPSGTPRLLVTGHLGDNRPPSDCPVDAADGVSFVLTNFKPSADPTNAAHGTAGASLAAAAAVLLAAQRLLRV